jgi:long-chain acyl-CoA synthetase
MLIDWLRRADPDHLAIVQGTRRLRYDDLLRQVERLAGGLAARGVRSGDVVAVRLPNSPEFITAFFACAWLGAIMLPLEPAAPNAESEHLLADTRPRLVVEATLAAELAIADATAPACVESRGPVLYLYTSGSTDERKRICCSQENLFYEALNFCETMGLTRDDAILCTIPLHHSYGIGNCLLDAAYCGSTLVLSEPTSGPFVSHAATLLDLVRREHVRFYPGVPHQFDVLSRLPGAGGLEDLRLCVASGDVLTRDIFERFQRRFGLSIRSLYGSTEAGSISVDAGADPKFGTLGTPLRNVAIEVRDSVIWVKSPVLPAAGYDGRPELNAQVFRDGWYQTGDMGYVDDQGRLVMSGRKQSFIDVGGHKVDLSEVEETLASHPLVREVAALGVEAVGVGTLLKAAVVADRPCTRADLLAHCRARLQPFKVPRVIELRDNLPRSPLGKVLKHELSDVTEWLDSMRTASAFARDWQATGNDERAALLTRYLREAAAAALGVESGKISPHAAFADMGFDSLRAAELHQRLEGLCDQPLPITMLWNHPSIAALAEALAGMLARLETWVEPIR